MTIQQVAVNFVKQYFMRGGMRRDFSEIRKTFAGIVGSYSGSLQLGLDIVLYFQGGFRAHSEGVLRFYEGGLEHVRDRITFYALDGSNNFKPIRPNVFGMPRFWASPEAKERGRYGLDLKSGPEPSNVGDAGFSFWDGNFWRTGHVRLFLPLDFIANSVEPFIRLAKDLSSKLPFIYGHAGFAVNMYEHFSSQAPDMPVLPLSLRFHGIDLGKPLFFEGMATEGIKSINWLTFLGSPMVEKLGGKPALQQALGSGNPIHDLPHGLMIQAGPEPGFGDVEQGETLPHYHQVGRAVRPLRLAPEVLQNDIGGKENTCRWLARFDD